MWLQRLGVFRAGATDFGRVIGVNARLMYRSMLHVWLFGLLEAFGVPLLRISTFFSISILLIKKCEIVRVLLDSIRTWTLVLLYCLLVEVDRQHLVGIGVLGSFLRLFFFHLRLEAAVSGMLLFGWSTFSVTFA